jgi:hypothetical protein
MESEVQEAAKVPRSELDSAFDVCRDRGWMVVPRMSPEAWGYVLYPPDGTSSPVFWSPVQAPLGMP